MLDLANFLQKNFESLSGCKQANMFALGKIALPAPTPQVLQ